MGRFQQFGLGEVMQMSGLKVGRMSRGGMFLCLIIGSIGFGLIQWWAFRRLNLTLDLGFRTDGLARLSYAPLWYAGLELAFDVALAVVAVGRLHDVGRSGWWLAAFLAGDVFASLTGLGVVALILIAGWLVLLVWPGVLGPNAYGADPYGWASKEQHDAQMLDLRTRMSDIQSPDGATKQ